MFVFHSSMWNKRDFFLIFTIEFLVLLDYVPQETYAPSTTMNERIIL